MRYNPDAEFGTSFSHIIILSYRCLHKQWHWPTSGSGKDVGCFYTVLSDVNLKSYLFLRNSSFLASRQYALQNQHVSFKPVTFSGVLRGTQGGHVGRCVNL